LLTTRIRDRAGAPFGRPLTTAATWATVAPMPRKSAAAIALLEPRGQRLEPPSGLSEAEQAAFVAAVWSVKPGHFAAEDVPLLVAYAAATVQERAIARELEAAEDEKAKDR
jgi:hypothetical protein